MKSKNFERYRKNFDFMELFLYQRMAFHEKAYTKRGERTDFFSNIRLAIYAIINWL